MTAARRLAAALLAAVLSVGGVALIGPPAHADITWPTFAPTKPGQGWGR